MQELAGKSSLYKKLLRNSSWHIGNSLSMSNRRERTGTHTNGNEITRARCGLYDVKFIINDNVNCSPSR